MGYLRARTLPSTSILKIHELRKPQWREEVICERGHSHLSLKLLTLEVSNYYCCVKLFIFKERAGESQNAL